VEDVQEQLTKELYGDNSESTGEQDTGDTAPDGGNDTGTDVGMGDTFSLGDKQYTKEELETLVRLGEIGREAEERYNTKLDRVWPEYSRINNENKELLEKIKTYETTQPNQANISEISDADKEQARKAAKELGILTRDELENLGVITGESFRTAYQRERAAERLLETATGLEKTYNGQDGRPAFKAEDMLRYMLDSNIQDPELAYKIRYEKELDSWKEQQLAKGRKPGLVTEQTSSMGAKTPKQVKITRDNLDQMIAEQLYGSN
jgi:hypothetical protein